MHGLFKKKLSHCAAAASEDNPSGQIKTHVQQKEQDLQKNGCLSEYLEKMSMRKQSSFCSFMHVAVSQFLCPIQNVADGFIFTDSFIFGAIKTANCAIIATLLCTFSYYFSRHLLI